jgi:hypothetical protein
VGRARIVSGWVSANTWAALVMLSGSCAKVRGHKAEGTSDVVLGTLVPCLGLGVLALVVEMISRVGGEGVNEGDGRGLILKHGGWMDG